ncbi:MAG: hypothetical protein IJG97_03110 [Bacilli bacterium]|nr:hypothetical protein [Bacilli bacterium]
MKSKKCYNQMSCIEKRDYKIENASFSTVIVYLVLALIGMSITSHLITDVPINAWLIIVSAVVTIVYITLIFENLNYYILKIKRF